MYKRAAVFLPYEAPKSPYEGYANIETLIDDVSMQLDNCDLSPRMKMYFTRELNKLLGQN